MPITVKLTPEQQSEIESEYSRLRDFAERGEVGMCIAQIFEDEMLVGIISPDKCAAMVASGAIGLSVIRTAADHFAHKCKRH